MEVINNVTASSYTTEYRKTETNNHEVFNAAKENVSDADKRLLGIGFLKAPNNMHYVIMPMQTETAQEGLLAVGRH